ncbi:TetR/AcrR family transcriptional regulator [Oleomonas cavernae]|uniref:TetR/AcrR family transcriptional regulator n=1 Tax=Oleomonas cavernae TaxID=2320859 RepID=A0A418VUK4_9PROT|nr:TetR/AcrR family transcriptional regulator [Oleomonas cavernae]
MIEAALAEFAEKGYAATRLEEVARRIGVSKGTIYVYFASKEELFKAMVRTTLVPLFEGSSSWWRNRPPAARPCCARCSTLPIAAWWARPRRGNSCA